MNLLVLVSKQMRQRALGTSLTVGSVMVGVALAIAIMIIRREGSAVFGQKDYGYDLVIGAKGSPLQLILNTVYHLDRSPGNIPYALFEHLSTDPQSRAATRLAVPIAVGDSYAGRRIVATTPALFSIGEDGASTTPFEYRPGRTYQVADGKVFHARKFEAVVGSDIPRLTGLHVGSSFKATHGMPAPQETPDIHDEDWTVVGVMKPTGTAVDRVLFIPLISFYCIAEHEEGLLAQAALKQGAQPPPAPEEHEAKHYTLGADGTIALDLPKSDWELSAILVSTRGPFHAANLIYRINNGNEAMAVNPASQMREFVATFLAPSTAILQLISYLVTVVAAVGILVSIYNSIVGRTREIAILRALGATRRRILSIVGLEATLIGALGAALGLFVGHLVAGGVSWYVHATMGESLRWWMPASAEWIYACAVVLLAALAGLVPGLKAYRVPVASGLVPA